MAVVVGRPVDYWRSGQGLGHVTPSGSHWPEGDDFPEFLARFIGDGLVVEFGCGPGRLAGLFPADRYVGVDVCPQAIEHARQIRPDHDFRLVDEAESLPVADVTLCHTVLLHVPDNDLDTTLPRFRSPRVVVSEILGRQWRRDGNPPVFNRSQADYAGAFERLGMYLARMAHRPYRHYPDAFLTVLEFRG